MTKKRLTDILIKNLKAPERGQKTHFDAAQAGFGLRVSQGGAKSFVVMFGDERRLKTIGRYPAMSLAEARKAARRVRVEADAESTAAPHREPISFALARDKFLADSQRRNKERTHQGYYRLLNRHFHFVKTLDELTRGDIMDAVEQLADTPSEQQHALVALKVMLNWCVKRGFIDHSPTPPMSFHSEPRSNVVPDDDLAAIWARAVETGYPYGSITRLLILTGQRRGEIAAMRRSWIDSDLVIFPAGFTKNKREHRLPLSSMAQKVIQGLPETGDLLFPARGSDARPFNGWGKSKERFDKPLHVHGYTLHDLRRTFSTIHAKLGTPIHVTEKLLNHVSGTISGVSAVYNRHSYLEEMRLAMANYDAYVSALLEQA